MGHGAVHDVLEYTEEIELMECADAQYIPIHLKNCAQGKFGPLKPERYLLYVTMSETII